MGQTGFSGHDPRAKSEQQRRREHQPGNNVQKSVCRSVQEQVRPAQASNHAGHEQRDHDPPRDIEPVAVGPRTGGHAAPQGDGLCSVRGDGWNAGEQQSGERDESAAAGHGIQRAGEHSGKEEEDGLTERQTTGVSRRRGQRLPWF